MENITLHLDTTIERAVKNLYPNIAFDFADSSVQSTKDKVFGDLQSNIAFKISKQLGKSPFEIAQELAKNIQISDEIQKAEAVKPGFINFWVKEESFSKVIKNILSDKEIFGKSELAKGKQIMIEFGQPNTHKAFHVGHLKSAISGLSMVRLKENLGYEVIKANYFGDVGMQVAKTTWAFIKNGAPQNFDSMDVHEKMKYIDSCYVYASNQFKTNKLAEEEIRSINKEIYAELDTENVKVYKLLRQYSLDHQNEVWKSLGVSFDKEYPESTVYKDALKIVDEHMDIFEKSEGAIIYRGENVGLTNWVFITGEGNPTYSAKDLGLANRKFNEYPDLDQAIVTTSVEQAAYFKVVIHVLEKIRPDLKGKYKHIPFGWMLRQDKKKFSSRMGDTVKGIDILNEVEQVALEKVSEMKDYTEEEKSSISHFVALAGLKFLILSHEFQKDFSYDPDKFLSFDGFSGPYVLYTYARAKSILKKSEKVIDSINSDYNFEKPEEKNLLKLLNSYPEVAQKAGINVTPHTISNYVYDLSQAFNSFYTQCPVLTAETEDVVNGRLLLTAATAQVLKNGLALLGIETVERM